MKIFRNLLLSLLSSVALTTSFYNIYDGGLKQVKTFIKIDYLPKSVLIIAFIAIFILMFFFYQRKSSKNTYNNLLAGLFTLFLVIGNGYELYGSFLELFKGYHFVLMIVNIFGYYFFIQNFIPLVKELFLKLNDKNLKENRIVRLFNRNPFWFCFITIFISWSIYYVAFYPIVLSPDPSYQIKQFLGEKTKYMDYSVLINENVTITNHHPVVHTVLLGSCLKLGRYLVNDNFGLFIYSFIQGIFLALTLIRTILFLKKRKINNRYLLLTLIGYALIPIFPLYAINANKDVYYTIIFINLTICVFEFIDMYKKRTLPWLKVLEMFTFSFLLCLFRNNGIFIIIPLYLALTIYSKTNLGKLLITGICTIGLYFSFTNILLPYLGITGTSIRETMSLFFQQTAREIKYYEKDINAKDKAAIAKIIDYDNAKKNYNPVIADPVKNTFNKYATKEDLKNYLMAWGRGLIKHPLVYVDATLNNTYGYLDPEEVSWYIYANYDKRITQNNLVDYHYNSLESLRTLLKTYGALFVYIPIVGLSCNIGLSTWLIIALTLYLFRNNKKYLIFLIPYAMSILICFASPVNTYFRYAMPIVFSEFFLIGIWFLVNKAKRARE